MERRTGVCRCVFAVRRRKIMRKVKVAATQMTCTWDREETLNKAEKLVREAAEKGAQIILLQELRQDADSGGFSATGDRRCIRPF